MKGNNNRQNTQKNGHRRSNSRHSNGNTNGSTNGNSANSNNSANGGSSVTSGISGADSGTNRLVYLITKAIGKRCIATTTNGARYQGLLANGDLSATGSSSLSVVLLNPVNVGKSLINDKSNIDGSSDLPETLIIPSKDLIDLEIQDVDLRAKHAPVSHNQTAASQTLVSPTSQPPTKSTTPQPSATSTQPEHVPQPVPVQPISVQPAQSTFKTDTDISGRGVQVRERPLQRWVPDEDTPSHPALLNHDTFGTDNGQWDQFKVNEEKFGVEATYDEHLYTTRINKSAPDYHERLARADRLAKEIEGSVTSDRHVLEERGIQVDDSGMDEEDKYSGVDRRGDELMAALRNASISSPEGGNALGGQTIGKYVPPRQRAAQYHNDPAIISSSATAKVKGTPPPGIPSSNVDNISAVSTPDIPPAKENGAAKTEAITAGTVDIAPTTTTTSTSAATASTVPPTVPTIKKKPDSIPAKPQLPPHNESFRLNAQSEINSLREFSANFKIPHKMPSDLLPILSKDKLKQDEIVKKQQQTNAAKSAQSHASVSATSQSPVSSDASVAATSSASVTPSQSTQSAAAVKKPAFKLNPKAAAFTPSVKHNQISPTPPKASFLRSPNNPSPRMNHQRPFTNGSVSSGSSSKRHHQISPADFFGGADRIPTKESQEKKVKDFKFAFSLFVTTRRRHEDKKEDTPVVYDKTFQTPPTWDSTIDETHDKLFPSINSPYNKVAGGPGMIMQQTSPFMPNPMMAPALPNTYGAPAGSKYPVSPHQQQAAAAAMAAHFQQQQFHAAMMYQQQQFSGGLPPGQPPMPMYPGGEPQFMPPGGFIPPPGGFVAGGSPVNGNMMMGGGSPYNTGGGNHNYNNHHSGGTRRYNNHHQNKRGGHS
ncbi:uncharacterized protein RJT20DRAFT_131825 [Scheffersomyces xylosifermentans]|uniref:uncharacterized protein n=1 Tax=Scheffersomyces xylosifermentans TaxID=1304137 RepID=UPI00315DB143